MSIYSNSINIKNRWINQYKQLIQNIKNEELNLLKFFLAKNYRLNKVYKKYVYKEVMANNSFYENNYKKIKIYLNELSTSNLSSPKLNKTQKNNFNFQTKKKSFENIISSIKNEENKKYEKFQKEEKEILDELKQFDSEIMKEYDKEIEMWLKEYYNTNNNNIMDNYNEHDSSSFFNINNIEKNNCRTLDSLEKMKIKNNMDSSKISDNGYRRESKKSIQNLIGHLNFKKNNDNIIRLTTSQMPQEFTEIFDNIEDPIQKYIDAILKEMDNYAIFSSNINSKSNKEVNNTNLKNNLIKEEKNIFNNISTFLNKMLDEYKNLTYLYIKIKYINKIIKEKMNGIYLGWEESEHKEFIALKNCYKDQSNTYIFLTSLNNLFPYISISELKKHIHLYEIYSKLEKIKKLLTNKYTQMKSKFESDKSRITKQSSLSVSKSNISSKTRYNTSCRKNKMSVDFKRYSMKSSYFNTNNKFYDITKRGKYLNSGYLQTNFNKYYNKNISNLFRKKKERFMENKNFSAIFINHSKKKNLNLSCNIYKSGIRKNIYDKYVKDIASKI